MTRNRKMIVILVLSEGGEDFHNIPYGETEEYIKRVEI